MGSARNGLTELNVAEDAAETPTPCWSRYVPVSVSAPTSTRKAIRNRISDT
jgi:hypothetical protein